VSDVGLIGGKAMGLSDLRRCGCRVPAAFVVTTRAYARHLRSDPAEPVANPDARLVAELREAYALTGHSPVAIRSSAPEEGSTATGRYLTVLNVQGEEMLVAAIAKAWRQAHAAKASSMALIVQRMLFPSAAGLMATRSPESADHVLIESVWGQGYAVAGGGSTDRFVVNRQSMAVKSHPHNKPQIVVAQPDGGIEWLPCPPEMADAPSLTPAQAVELATLGLHVEAVRGHPVAIEWAIVDSEVYALQATRIAEPDAWDAPRPARPHDRWSRLNMIDLVPEPVMPFTWSLCAEHWAEQRRADFRYYRLPEASTTSYFQLHDCRLYSNVGAYHSLLGQLGRASQALAPYDISTDSPQRHQLDPHPLRIGRLVRHMPGLLMTVASNGWLRFRSKRAFEDAPGLARRYRSIDLDKLDAQQTWATFNELWTGVRRLESFERALDASAFSANRVLEVVSHRWLGNQKVIRSLVVGDDSNGPNAIARELAGLGRLVEDPAIAGELRTVEDLRALSPKLDDAVRQFLDRHGHRCRGELDWGRPRWAEDPQPVLAAIEAQVRAGAGKHVASASRDEAAHEKTLAFATIARLPGERILPWRRLIFSLVLRRARKVLPARSIPRDRVMMVYFEGRRMLLHLGTLLVKDGVLQNPSDIFLITVDEISAIVGGSQRPELQELVHRRDLKLRRAASRPTPDVLDANGRSLDEEPAQRRVAELSGRGAVPGTVQGRVKILSRPEDARGVEVGCVLVLASADIGSTLLFPQAGAMVVERGGLLSHAIVLAREFGLPAVIGVTGATSILRNGDLVSVDGDAGIVKLLERDGSPDRNARPSSSVATQTQLTGI
jgi:pyruvate,water dikinase